jgi:crotonobetainyl-CoA:carnitine CoA-transferase CaiB-like acyl-CoA transferase
VTAPLLLQGIRVIEFSHMVMGPSSGLVLADLGADVIKVEPAGSGDNTRSLAGSGAGFFATFNRNKRSIAIDLKSKKGIALVKRLISNADVMTENFRSGALEGLGLSYETLAQSNPRLIHCSMKGFLSGPYENRTALDEVVQMLGGLAYMTGPPGRPLRAGASVNDIMGGMFAVIGILAALNERQTTGKGRSIKAGLFENCMYLMGPHMMQFSLTGKPASPMPNRLASWAVYDVFDTSDGSQVFVGVVTDTQWSSFCSKFGLQDLLDDPAFASNSSRVKARDGFMPRLRSLFQGLTRAYILAECEAIGLPFAPINRPEDMFDDPHLQHQGAMLNVTLPNGRPAPTPALPLEIDGKRFGLRQDIPSVGEHSSQICRELGLSEDEITELLASGEMTVTES